MSYQTIYNAAKSNPEKFWMEAANQVDWITPPSKALFEDNAPFYEWFSDAEVNTCFNAVDLIKHPHIKQDMKDEILWNPHDYDREQFV